MSRPSALWATRVLLALSLLTFVVVLWVMLHDPHPEGACTSPRNCAALDSLLQPETHPNAR